MPLRITGFEKTQLIYNSRTTIVWRALDTRTDKPAILKILRDAEHSVPSAFVRYQHEYEVLRSLDFDGAIRVYDLLAHKDNCFLVLEDFGAESLRDILARGERLSCAEVLALAAQVAHQLSEIHARDIIHKDINPSNILWNRETGVVKIIDFGISILHGRDSPGFSNPGFSNPEGLAGTLAYMAPEQSGRMNRTVDYRADFYGFGATLYEAFSGQPPFATRDPLELVHCHLARAAIPLHVVNPEVPEMVSRIVMKLLAKTAEERYQSASGIQSDLEECLGQLCRRGDIAEFALGRSDVATSLRLSERLYGRASETAILWTAFSQAAEGARVLAKVTGASGIGKTSVVKELYRPITEHRGYYFSGKYDRLCRDMPYSGILAAFQGLLRQLLTEDEDSLAVWRDHFTESLGRNGQLIIDVIPEFERIIGPQPPLPEVSSPQEQKRFVATFQSFVRALCAAERPLVLFLDDLQWADSASLALIEIIMTDRKIGHFLFICAYREHEVTSVHPVMRTLDAVERSGLLCYRVNLGPLGDDDLAALVADSLWTTPDRSSALAALLMEKTGGNPFFVLQFLRLLNDQELLAMDPEAGQWRWDTDGIRDQDITDNIVELLITRLSELPEATQKAIHMASLLGGISFDLSTLAVALEQCRKATFDCLGPAIASGVVMPRSGAVQSNPGDLSAPLVIETLRFAHDRLLQASYQLIEEEDREATHLRIGRLLRDRDQPGERDIFAIVNHLNLARARITDVEERRCLAELNLEAGERALRSHAIDAAATYFEYAMAELSPQDWTQRRDFAHRVTLNRARAELRRGDIAAAESLLKKLIAAVENPIDLSVAYSLLIHGATLQSRFEDARAYTTAALEPLGVEICGDEAGSAALLQQIERAIGARPMAELAQLPTAEDAETEAILRILSSFTTAALHTSSDLYRANGLQTMDIMLERGIHGLGIYGFGIFGSVLQERGDFTRAAEAGRLSIDLAERFGLDDRISTTCLHYGASLIVWVEHVRNAIPILERGVQTGLATGAPHLASYNLCNILQCRLLESAPLTLVAQEAKDGLSFALEHQDLMSIDCFQALVMLLTNLAGSSRGPFEFHIGDQSEDQLMAQWQKNRSNYALGIYLVNRALVHLLYGSPGRARESLERARPFVPYMINNPALIQRDFLEALCLIRLLPRAAPSEQAAMRQTITALHRSIAGCARLCPDNFGPMEALVGAEIARLDGDWVTALRLYEEGQSRAAAQGFLQYEGLAHERLGNLWVEQDRPHYARHHLRMARSLFRRWGATRKVAHLESTYAELLEQTERRDEGSNTTLDSSEKLPRLDWMSVLKASQTISGEMVLERLLDVLLRVAFSNAGAQRGTLFLKRDRQMIVIAEGRADAPNDIAVLLDTPLEDWQGCALSVVNYVARTGERVILGRAAQHQRFARDPYIATNQVRSVLCMPLTGKGTLVGVLYLENNFAYDAFTEARFHILELIAGQMAISLENAYLHEGLTRALKEAQESERLKSEFLATTSHELRTPLNAIINIPELILAEIAHETVIHCPACSSAFDLEPGDVVDDDTPCPECQKPGLQREEAWTSALEPRELASLLQSVLRSGRHLLSVVSSILDLSRLESGRGTLRLEVIDVGRIFDEVREVMEPIADRKEVSLAFSIIEDENQEQSSAALRADPVKLRQIVTNLVENAIKFSTDGGRVEVTGQAHDAKTWQLSVRDHGIGIPADSHESIFESFRQVHRGYPRDYGGSGLGLTIVRKLCQLHGGSIRVESEPGQGSTFFVHLPFAASAGMRHKEAAGEKAAV